MSAEQKRHPVSVRMKPTDVERLKELAEACGVPHSTLASAIVLKYLEHPQPLLGSESEEPDGTDDSDDTKNRYPR
jgi:hypothetical protein